MDKKTRLLVVDDDTNLVEIYSHILAREGFEVIAAATGQGGLELARKKKPDLVLLDVGLPDITGLEVCRQLKADPALVNTLVVLVSGAATGTQDKVTGLDVGADDYILKSADWTEIRARIRTLVRLREAMVALRASEQHYRQLLEILPDSVASTDMAGRFKSANAQTAAMLGYENVAELLTKSAFDLTPPEEHPRVVETIRAAQQAGVLRDAESVALRKNGERFLLELSIAVLKDSRGRPSGLVTVGRDVTRRKQAEEQLRASEERFRQIAENIREVFWMTNVAKDGMIYVSPGYDEIWGRSRERLYATPREWVESIHPDDRERVLEAALTQQTDGRYHEVYRIVRPDGSIRWIEDRAFPIRDQSGTVYRIAGIAEDITQQRQVEDSLRESEARKGAIMQAALDGIITFDHTGKIVEVNFAAEKMFGYPGSAFCGKLLADMLLPPSLQPWFELGLASSFATDEGPILGSRIEITALRAHQVEFPVEICITRIELVGPPLFTAFVRDISARRRTETKLMNLAHAIETTAEIIYITDPKDRISFVNRAFLATYGYAEVEVMGKLPAMLLAPEVPPAVAAEMQEQTRNGGWRGELMHRRKNGISFPVFLSTSPIRDRTGLVVGYMRVAQDISERQRAEEQLRLLADAMRSTRDLIYITDARHRFTFVNGAFREAYGYADEELRGKTPELLCAAKTPPELWRTVLRSTTEAGWQGEMQHVGKSGREFPVSLTTSSIKNADGSILNLVFVGRDVSERRRVLEALESSQQLQKAILDNLSDPMWLRDREGRFLAGNEPLAKFLGLPLEQIVGKSVAELASPVANRLTGADEQVLLARQPTLTQEKLLDAHGIAAWFEILNSPILSRHGRVTGTVGIARNVTERKQVEDVLRKLPQRIIDAQEAERLRVARDLHDGVNQVIASAKMRLRKVEELIAGTNPAGAEILARCEKLLVQALEENRRIAHNLRPSDLDELGLAAACRNFCDEVESRSNLKLKFSAEGLNRRLPPEVELNLFRILQEAVNNVEKHARARTVRLRMVREAEQLILTVRDDGKGFARKSSRQPGSQRTRPGIGLTNMQERAASLGGTCIFGSAPKSGTIVTVKIPLP
jgi:PAS domain S-box-containing protein